MTNNFNFFNQLANYNCYKIDEAVVGNHVSISSETKIITEKNLFQYKKPNNMTSFNYTCKIYKKKILVFLSMACLQFLFLVRYARHIYYN